MGANHRAIGRARWGDKVSGWWFDGCYWPNAMYRSAGSAQFRKLRRGGASGKSEQRVAFNPGVIGRLISVSPDEDYTAGEVNDVDRILIRRVIDSKVDGPHPHVLSFLGQTWGKAVHASLPSKLWLIANALPTWAA